MRSPSAAAAAAEISRVLKRNGSSEHARGVQGFFKQEISSYGWYAADLRRLARHYARCLEKHGLATLVHVANRLFTGRVLEEKVFAVLLLEKLTLTLDESHFDLFESWLDRVTSWADHDALVHYLLAPMIVADPARAKRVFHWAQSPDRWRRRAACVALIQGARRRMFFSSITRVSRVLLCDKDDMVQKGLGWLLREAAKADPKRTVPYLLRIRQRAPRLVLRTACETLPKKVRAEVLKKPPAAQK